MNITYTYRFSSKIKQELENLEVLRRVIDLLPVLPHVEENLRRQSLLKSSLFSARIEGNKLDLDDLTIDVRKRETKNIAKKEIYNILSVLEQIYGGRLTSRVTLEIVQKIHKHVLKDLTPQAGYFRNEPSAIFNSAGIAVYVTPPPSEIKNHLKKLITIVNSPKEPGPIQAAKAHFAFEKIHPFLDGNGRVGRLLSVLILQNCGFGFRGLVSLEQYLEENRSAYYRLLDISSSDITDFVEFFIEGLRISAERALDKRKNIEVELPQDTLLPRRREILEIIKDHQMVSFSFLQRRFMGVPASSLHYDLAQLLRQEFIKKLGTTRGAVYMVKN